MNHDGLIYRELGIDSQHEFDVYMRKDCPVCVSEGFEALTRLRVIFKGKHIIASLNVVESDILSDGEIGLSRGASKALKVKNGDKLHVSHMSPINSFGAVRSKLFGKTISRAEFQKIVNDIAGRRYSNVQIAAFLSACTSHNTSIQEIIHLTQAMIKTGKCLTWDQDIVADKHCIGGLPGNRTTPIIVSIIAAAGVLIPKTSSRAITSPAGTADTMEALTRVDLSMKDIKRVVKQVSGCLVWGGAVQLSPADDLLIRIERTLDLDSETQLIASVLSKKKSAGSTHVLIDIPVGKTAKVRSQKAAENLKEKLEIVGQSVGLKILAVITDGRQPIGTGIGPSLEARDVVAVLKDQTGPADLEEKSVHLSGQLLEMVAKAPIGQGNDMAQNLLKSGKAYDKFIEICEAQGTIKTPQTAPLQHDILSPKNGVVTQIHNRRLARLAKLAGAPFDETAGVLVFKKLNDSVQKNEPLFQIHAETEGELAYALSYLDAEDEVYTIG